ncbi:MAG: hypothetical protein Fur0041_06820 [Bacteroidia bacterium]
MEEFPEQEEQKEQNQYPDATENTGHPDLPFQENETQQEEQLTLKKKKRSLLREWTEALLFAFFGVLILKIFIAEPFAIPSDSMEGTLKAGDYVIVNKLAYGARVPMTPLTVPFTHQTAFGMKSYVTWWTIPYLRIPGFADIERNDVIVFNFPAEDQFPISGHEHEYPIDHRTHFIKRCVAVPGDTIAVKDKDIYINGKALQIPSTLKFNYIVKIDTIQRDSISFDRFGIVRESFQGPFALYTVNLNQLQADSLRLIKKIVSVEPEISRSGSYEEQVFPHSDDFPWNLDNFGPLLVPAKGSTIPLSVDSLPLWERIIVHYEHKQIDVRNDSIFINGVYSKTYTFEMNYYFVMGDNRHYSMDSRYWGFVPEDHIVGRAGMILFSVNRQTGSIRGDRWFKSIE